MKFPFQITVMTLGLVLLCSLTAQAETAAEAFARGDGLLANGDLQKAMGAYSIAARGDRNNQRYRQQYMLVRRIVALESSLEREKSSTRWLTTAQSLRSFYTTNKLFDKALTVDEKIHAKLNTGTSAGQLAETHLALGKPADASRMLASLPPKKATKYSQAMLAIALARQGQVEEAQKASEGLASAATTDPGTLYVQSRMQAVLGNQEAALQLLTRCIEGVAPSRLAALKRHAKNHVDFATLVSTAAFATVMETESKVAESKCSSGSSCATCPMRGGCARSQGK